ncbi:MAG: ferritin-like domain-containing protein, partial [Acidobacteriota bacterium]|nr:ferritin-like domain-containing protein [Acidobacteriota bacterium]
LQDLLVEEIRDLYDAEKQLIRALPKMAKAASDSELGEAFREHLEQTKGQARRIEEVFGFLEMKPKSKLCQAMKGLVEEGQETMGEDMEDSLMDCAIIGAARRIEHYEMAGYDTARSLAQSVGIKEISNLLQETLNEETQADKRLMQIAKRLVKDAGRPPAADERGGKSASIGSAKPTAKGTTKKGGSKAGAAKSTHSGHTTTDHDEIRQWAEARGAHPACVRGTGKKGGVGMIRLDFPGFSGEKSLQEISWDEWFQSFDDNDLALVYQEETVEGQKSNFNKLVSRKTVQSGKARSAR